MWVCIVKVYYTQWKRIFTMKLWQGYVLHVSVSLFTGGDGWWYASMHCRWYPSMPCSRSPRGVVSQHALQVSRPTPRREVEGSGLGKGVSRPTPREGSWEVWPGGGGVSRPTLRGYPSMRWGRHPLRTVRILLECILVSLTFVASQCER